VLLALCRNVAGHDGDGDHGSSHLWLESPESLAEKYDESFMNHREALFGIPSYGEELSARVIYATPGTPDSSGPGCDAYPTETSEEWQSEGQFILLIDRGTCNFVRKVRNAEEAGAVAVIIADQMCLTSDPYGYCDDFSTPVGGTSSSSPGTCPSGPAAHSLPCVGSEQALPFMANDGSGDNIRIPSLIVSNYDAQNLKSALCNKSDKSQCNAAADYDQTVIVTLEWDVPADDDHVDWEIWTSSEDWYGAEFKREFARVAKDLEDSTDFTPRYLIFDGTVNCMDATTHQNKCPNNCISSGRYCAQTPHGDLVEGLKGVDVVIENLRQMCIWNITKADGHEYRWWDYVVDFADQCFGEEGVETSEDFAACSRDVQSRNQISTDAVDACVQRSGGTGDGDNELLRNDLADAKELLIFELPSIVVNGALLRISPSYGPVLTAICAAFLDGTEPEVCDSVLDPSGTDEGEWMLQVNLVATFDTPSFTVDDFNWQLQSEFRSQLAFKAGVSKTSTTLEHISQKTSNSLTVHLLFHHLTNEELDDAKSGIEVAAEHDDIRFYTANSQSQQTSSVLVTVTLDETSDDPFYVHNERVERNKYISQGSTGTTSGVIVMLVLLTIAIIVLSVAVIALWRRVGLAAKDLNIFGDMIAVPHRFRPGSQMREADPVGHYRRPLADDEGSYAAMRNDDDDDDDEQPDKAVGIAL